MTSAGVVYLLAKYADLTVNGQSQAILGILVIGAGTDYALLLVARYREELRRHEDRHEAMAFALHRAAPAILASAATVVRRHALPDLRRAQLHRRPGPGATRSASRVTFLVMVTLLPGAAGHLRPLDLLAQAPDVRLRRAHQHRLLGPGRQPDRPATRARSGSITAGLLAIACLGLFRLDAVRACRPRTPTPRSSTRSRASSCSPTTAWPTTPTPSRSSPTPTRCPTVAGGAGRRSTGSASPRRAAGPRRRALLLRGHRSTPTSPRRRRSTSSRPPATRSTTVDGADALVGGGAAFYLDTKIASNRDNKVIIPIVLVVVFLILIGLLRALTAPLILIGTVVLSFGAALGISALLFEYVVRLRRVRSRVPAVRVRVPGGPGHRLQHLPDDPGPRGDGRPAAPARAR